MDSPGDDFEDERVSDAEIGFVVGVLATIASTSIIGLVVWIWKRNRGNREKKNQLESIRKLIIKFRRMIFDVKSDLHIPQLKTTKSVDELRSAYYGHFRRQLTSALDGRTSQLTFDEIEEIRTIFLGLHELHPNFVPNEKWYVNTFNQAVSIKWLRLTPMVETQD